MRWSIRLNLECSPVRIDKRHSVALKRCALYFSVAGQEDVCVLISALVFELNSAMTSCVTSETTTTHRVNVDPLAFWLQEKSATYRLRIHDHRHPEKTAWIDLLANNQLQITQVLAHNLHERTAPYGRWVREHDTALCLKWHMFKNEEGDMHFLLLPGTRVYKQVGKDKHLYLIPYTVSTFDGPVFGDVARFE